MYTIAKLLLNSLYGRFGLNPNILEYSFMKLYSYNKLANKSNIVDFTEFGNVMLVGKENNNVMVALSVTAYARILISRVKNDPNFILLYTDTDSVIGIGDLPKDIIDSTKLGSFKLENEYFKFISIAPKVYGVIDIKGNEYTKVKGFKEKLSLSNLESLLYKDSHLKLKHEKWFKDFNKSTIEIKLSEYDLKITHNKRISLFNTNNKFYNTKNIIVKNKNPL